MSHFVRCLLVAALALGCASSRESSSAGRREDALTLERMLAQPAPAGTAPAAPAWSPDGRRLAFLWNDAGLPRREVWLVDADGGGLRRLTVGAEDAAGVHELAWMPASDALVYLRGGELWRADLGGGSVALASGGPRRSRLAVSPDGRHLSFLQAGDLWLVDAATGAAQRATQVGVAPLSKVPLGRYRRPDVEIGPYIWGGPAYAWSPDGRTIAVHHVDRRHLPAVPFPHYLGEETDPNPVRRGYPGDANEARRVGLYSLDTGELSLLDLPAPTEVRVVDFSWSPDGRLLVDRESDTAVERWLHVLDAGTGELRQLWHDRRESRIYTSIGSAWHADGEGVLFVSDRGDRYGLWLLAPGSDEPRLLTPPAYDVTAGPFVARGGAVYYQANQPSAYERHVYRLSAGGGPPTRVTRLPGQHAPTPSPDGSRVALLHSSDTTPTELRLVSGDGAAGEERITASPPAEFADREWARARYASFPSRIDGYTIHARILEPRELEPGRRYPVVFGPVYSNTVRNRWAGRWALIQQLLVDRGYVVVQVDVRGSTGYGRAFREEFLVDFAGRDLDDLESAVDYVKTLPHVDPDRLGIWGSSYGGTLTLYSLLKKPGLFRAGVACASAVDPHFFGGDDVAIVRRPETHPEAFLRGAAQYAGNLEDHLLLIHGMQDQVVPFKTVVDLAEELMLAGKDFDFAFAPAGTHGWSGPPHYARYLFGKLIAHFDRHLGGS
ncbi:MAG: prolyl oligopeptidase family serine peptidase [Planctomycetota bacterium]